MEGLEQLQQYIPLLVPILLIQLGLVLFALIDLIRRPQTRGPKWLWALIIFVSFVGPILYLVIGRDDA